MPPGESALILALGAGLADGLLLRLDANGRCSECRGPGLAGFSISGDELRARLANMFLALAVPSAVGEAIRDALAGLPAPVDARLRVTVMPTSDPQGSTWVLIQERAAVAPDAALRARETRFRALIEHGADGVMLLDARGKVLFQGPVQLFGYAPDSLLGQDGFSYIHPGDRPRVQEAFARLIGKPGGQEQTEYRFRDHQGRWRYVGVTATNRLHDPALAAVVVNYRDVDERRRADDAMRLLFIDAVPGADFFPAAARHLAAALDVRAVILSAIAGPRLIALAASGMPITAPTPPAEAAVPVPPGASVDEPRALDLDLPAQELSGTAAAAALAESGGERLRMAGGARLRFPADRRLAALGADHHGALVLRDSDGTAIGLVEVAHDRPVEPSPRLARLFALVAARAASELLRVRVDTARLASEELNRQILESIPGGIFHVGADGVIRHANHSAQTFLGRTRDELIGMHVGASAARTIREDGSPFPAADYPVMRCLATGVAQSPAIIGVRRSDGQTAWGLFNAVPLIDPAGIELPGAVVMFIDLTERKRLEDRLTQAHKLDAVGKLAGGVAHDFNNLLCVILGRLDRVIERLAPVDPLRHDLQLAHRTAVRATALTRQLLAVSRQQAAAPRVVDLNAVVTGMGELLAGLAGERVVLRILAGERLGMVRIDPNQVEQVVVNLAVNARDAMPKGGTLTIQTSNAEVRVGIDGLAPGSYVLLAVKDTGTGIDPVIRERIFEPFFTTKGVGQGTGLGLALVAEIVAQAGGKVNLASEPGRGSMFLVYLPRCDEQPGGSTSALHRIRPGRGRETILLVEDHADVRELLTAQLTGLGYIVLTANSGEEALVRAEQHPGPLDLLVTDMVMPGIGGRELAQRLGGSPRPKVLYISGYTSEDIAATLIPGQAFLQKPFSGAVLAQKVRDLIDGVEG